MSADTDSFLDYAYAHGGFGTAYYDPDYSAGSLPDAYGHTDYLYTEVITFALTPDAPYGYDGNVGIGGLLETGWSPPYLWHWTKNGFQDTHGVYITDNVWYLLTATHQFIAHLPWPADPYVCAEWVESLWVRFTPDSYETGTEEPGAGDDKPYIVHVAPDFLLRGYEAGSDIRVQRSTRSDIRNWADITTPFAGQQPCVAQDVTGTPYVLYTDGASVKRRNVYTGTEATMASGKRPFERWSPGWAFRVLTYWRVTGAGPNGVSYFMRYDASGAVMTAETALVSDVPEQAVSVDWQANGTLTALYSDGTNIHTLTSTDNGATWA